MINNIVLLRLKEREKELNTLYKLDELLTVNDLPYEKIFAGLIDLMPSGWQYSTICEVRISFEETEWKSEDFRETEWMQKADITIDNDVKGEICVVYLQFIKEMNGSQFLPEEQKLLNTIAERVGNYIFQQRLRNSLKAIKLIPKKDYPESKHYNKTVLSQSDSDQHWKWRLKKAERISELMDFEKFNVKAVYIIGSTKNATAGPASDIDLLVHHNTNESKIECLKSWLDGWGLCLAEENFQRTGYRTHSLIDLHLVNDSDLESKTSFAVMIGAITDPAKLLRK